MRYALGLILTALSAISLILMLCYYGESVAIWPAVSCGITFVLAAICFTENK